MRQPRVPVLPLLVFLGVLSGGCSSALLPSLSSNPWFEVRTDHFVLRTDLSSADAKKAAIALESTRNAIIAAAWPSGVFPEKQPTEVYVVGDRRVFDSMSNGHVGSFFSRQFSPAFYLTGPPKTWEDRESLAVQATSTLRYNMVLQLAEFVYPQAPPWFSAGLAHFLEPIHLSDDGTQVIVGQANPDELRRYRQHRTVDVRQLFAWGPEAVDDARVPGLHGLSWMFVHWLYNKHPEEFVRYQTALIKGMRPDRAWSDAFPKFDPEAADLEVHHYSQFESSTIVSQPFSAAPITPPEPVAVSSADAHAFRARLLLAGLSFAKDPKHQEEEATVELNAAVAADVNNVEALLLDTTKADEAKLVRVRRIIAAHPDEARVHARLAELLEGQAGTESERETAYRNAARLAPSRPVNLARLANFLIATGREKTTNEALAFGARAVKLAPWHSVVRSIYASALFRAGACKTAIAEQERAMATLPEGANSQQLRAQTEEQLATFKTSCAAKASTAPPAAP
jgi:hypothetical protein